MKVSEISNIESLIKTCAKLAGIRNELEADDYLVIQLVLKEEYPNLSADFLRNAFVKYGSGKLGEFEHYGSFTTLFLGKVINAYKENLRKENLKPKVQPIEKQIEGPIEDLTGERAFNFIKNIYEKEGKAPIFANWNKAFYYAEKEGLINLTDEDKLKLKEKVKRELRNEYKNKRNLAASVSTLAAYSITDIELKKECRKSALINYFKK